jgi:hypothetical protein
LLNLASWLWLPIAVAQAGSDWQTVLDTHRGTTGRVNYGAIHRDGTLDGHLKTLEDATEPADRAAAMALWINAYNALTVDLVADHFPIASIRDLDGGEVWKTRHFTVAGRSVTLDSIEHQILRPMGDPRVHFALNCAALGCPTLRAQAFKAESMDAQLEQASQAWIATQGIQIDRPNQQLRVSKIFDWYASDFVPATGSTIPGVDGRLQGVLQFIALRVKDPDAQWLRNGGYELVFLGYDWRVNGTGT